MANDQAFTKLSRSLLINGHKYLSIFMVIFEFKTKYHHTTTLHTIMLKKNRISNEPRWKVVDYKRP